MKEKGMGRTRLGRFAAVTIPATVASVGLGAAMLNGMVGAALASSSAFQVTGSQATGDGMELTANYVEAATSETDITVDEKADALVSLKNGALTDMCLAADTNVPVVGTLGIKIQSSGEVGLGSDWTDLAANSLNGDTADLGTTHIGFAQDDLVHQDATTSNGYRAGGFGMQTVGNGSVDIGGLDAELYALTLDGLSLANLAISATPGGVAGTC